MKAYIWQLIFATALVLIVLDVVEAPNGFLFVSDKPLDPEKEITLAFAGDMMLGRNVEVLMGINGRDYPFASTSELFEKADFVVGNLEGPVPLNHRHTKTGEMSFSFPQFVPELLRQHGIDAVSLANNHTYDRGANVYTETMYGLQIAQVSPFGHPTLETVSYAQNYIVKGVPFTLLGFNSTYPTFDLSDAAQAVSDAKEMFPEGIIIVFMHWGDEYQLTSNEGQKKIASVLRDAGAELIIGAHPHVVQEVACDTINTCTLFSLGNFIFDQYFSKDVEQGLVAYVTLTKDAIKQIELLPIEGNHSKPRKMKENKDFIKDLIGRSNLGSVRLSTSSGSIVLKP